MCILAYFRAWTSPYWLNSHVYHHVVNKRLWQVLFSSFLLEECSFGIVDYPARYGIICQVVVNVTNDWQWLSVGIIPEYGDQSGESNHNNAALLSYSMRIVFVCCKVTPSEYYLYKKDQKLLKNVFKFFKSEPKYICLIFSI